MPVTRLSMRKRPRLSVITALLSPGASVETICTVAPPSGRALTLSYATP